MDMADKHGSGWVSVKNTFHYGIAGYYSLKAVRSQTNPTLRTVLP